MAITKSAKKALRQSSRKRKFNVARKEAMKGAVKYVKKLKEEGKKTELAKALSLAYKAIDKATKRGVIKKGSADRKKSRLAKSLSR